MKLVTILEGEHEMRRGRKSQSESFDEPCYDAPRQNVSSSAQHIRIWLAVQYQEKKKGYKNNKGSSTKAPIRIKDLIKKKTMQKTVMICDIHFTPYRKAMSPKTAILSCHPSLVPNS